MEEPLEDYLEAFDDFLGISEDLLEATVDLTQIEMNSAAILSDTKMFNALRYIAAPPISLDDLKTVAAVTSISAKALQADPDAVKRILETVQIGLDRRRFPWVTDARDASEEERRAAVLASAALMASNHVGTKRRNVGKTEQEEFVEGVLIGAQLTKVATRAINTVTDAPDPGEFCRECMLGTRKADFVVRLFDNRILALECKVSNSATNSVKRLNNDAAAKAEVWISEFGDRGVVPAALLSGVYKTHNLLAAQRRGLTIFWSHRLAVLTDWIHQTQMQS